ncbi:RNA chaperone Hfq [Desulfurobacterium atlanticum]|uniref:RNA-binding protein Hfq n=1 Tax=Desulfurobacterium atlanticum TaxID=240169 RepID=A0A238XIH0_9BACT|nr:host factor-I protein [Desulfurobacterium atlanticum]
MQPMKVQDAFLNKLRKEKIPVNIFLTKGIKLQGIVVFFDQFTIILENEDTQQLVYKHSIATIVPLKPIKIFVYGEENSD